MKKRVLPALMAVVLCLVMFGVLSVSAATTVNVSTVSELQSAHPYSSNMDTTWVYTHPTAADSLEITFSSDTETESNYDWIYILDGNGNQIEKQSGTALAGKTVTVPGNVVKIKLTSDGSVTKNGFTVTNVVASGANDTNPDDNTDSGSAGEVTIVDCGYCSNIMLYIGSGHIRWELNSNGQLRIYGTYGYMADYYGWDGNGGNTFWDKSAVRSIVIEEGVPDICQNAFSNCDNLTQVTIPSNIKTIGANAFAGCDNLTSVIIQEGVTTIKQGAFSNCTKLQSITIPNSVTTLETRVFQNSTGLQRVNLGNGVSTIVTELFKGCSNLKSITIPSAVKKIENNAFSGCDIDNIYIQNLQDWCNITYSDSAHNPMRQGANLYINGNLATNITLPTNDVHFDTALSGCESMVNLTIPEGIQTIQYYLNYQKRGAFEGCINLETVTIASTVTELTTRAFYGCNKLKTVTLVPSNSLSEIGSYAFYNCTNLEIVKNAYYVDVIGPVAFYNCRSLKEFLGSYNSVETIGENAFEGCSSLKNIELSYSTKTVGAYAFKNCSNIEYISFRLSNPLTIGESAFAGCNKLNSVYVQNIEHLIASSFANKTANPLCGKILQFTSQNNNENELVIPDGVTNIPDYMFEGCSGLKKVVIPESVTNIGNSVFKNSNFELVNYEGSKEGWENLTIGADNGNLMSAPKLFGTIKAQGTLAVDSGSLTWKLYTSGTLFISGTKYMEYMSSYPWNSYASTIKEIVVEDGVKSISDRAFGSCNNLESIYIGNTVESIGSEAIYHSSKLKTLNIPDSVKSIGNWAFEYCERLTDITIGKGLEIIEKRPFRYNMTQEYKIDDENPNFKAIDGHIYTKDGKKLVRYAIGNTSTEYTIPDGTTTIGFAAFESAIYLKTLYVPLSLTSIESDAFWMVDSHLNRHYLDAVYYEGSKSQWDKINVVSGWNYAIEEANVHYAKRDVVIKDTDGNVLKQMIVDNDYVVLQEDIPKRDKYNYELYTDENCINKYVLGDPVGADLNLFVKYTSESLNKFIINENVQSVVGNTGIKYTLSFATDKDASSLYCFIKYPDTLSLKSVTAKDFIYVEKEDEYTEGGFTTAVILAQYSDTELIPKNVIHTPFELVFDISKSAEPGTVQIEATEESCLIGNDTYFFEERIPGTLEILPKLAESIEISGADVISSEATYTAIVNPDYTTDKSVEWSVDDEIIATVDENGVVTPVTSGTFTLTATAKDGSGVYASKTITVTRGITSIEIVGADSITETTTYSANILPDYATNKELEWSINNPEIATVDENGAVTPVTSGLVILTITAKDGSGVSATKEINIIKLAESIEITGEDSISSPAQYTAIVSPDYTSDKEVSWSVDDETIATVDELGIVTPVTSGTIVLTATSKDEGGIFATKIIEVVKYAESIEIVGEDEITEPSQYSVVILPEYTTNKDAKWFVSDETIATVDENGVVTPLKNGKIVLTAKAEDASGIETTKSIVITVSVRANSITSDVGVWDKEFDSDITEYTINVPVGTTAVYLTTSFTDATAKVNGSIAANGVRKKVALTGAETVVEIVLTPTSENSLKANIYTIKVVCGSFTKTTISEDGKAFTVNPVNIETGKTVILALYEDGKLVEMQPEIYEGEAITFITSKKYTNVKNMVWDNLTSFTPACDVEVVK